MLKKLFRLSKNAPDEKFDSGCAASRLSLGIRVWGQISFCLYNLVP